MSEKYVVVFGMCGYLPNYRTNVNTLAEMCDEISFLRKYCVPGYTRCGVVTPSHDIRAKDILSGGVCYYNDREWVIEVYPNGEN